MLRYCVATSTSLQLVDNDYFKSRLRILFTVHTADPVYEALYPHNLRESLTIIEGLESI